MHAGGAVMWVGGDAIMFALMMIVFLMWSTDTSTANRSPAGWRPPAGPRSPRTPPSLPADIDDDEEQLAAYNAYLQGLNDPGAGSTAGHGPNPRHAG